MSLYVNGLTLDLNPLLLVELRLNRFSLRPKGKRRELEQRNIEIESIEVKVTGSSFRTLGHTTEKRRVQIINYIVI